MCRRVTRCSCAGWCRTRRERPLSLTPPLWCHATDPLRRVRPATVDAIRNVPMLLLPKDLLPDVQSTMTIKSIICSIFIWWDSTKSSNFAAENLVSASTILRVAGLKGNQVWILNRPAAVFPWYVATQPASLSILKMGRPCGQWDKSEDLPSWT